MRNSRTWYESCLTAALMAVAAVGCYGALSHAPHPWGDSPSNARRSISVSPSDLARRDDLCLGSADATPKLVMFGDYQCPPCRAAWARIEETEREHPGQFAVYFRNYPLTSIHPDAFGAAVAAETAKVVGGLPKAHAMLYSGDLKGATLRKDLTSLGVPPKRQASEELASAKRVADDMDLGRRLGVSGTPSFFLVNPDGSVYSVPSLDSLPFRLAPQP